MNETLWLVVLVGLATLVLVSVLLAVLLTIDWLSGRRLIEEQEPTLQQLLDAEAYRSHMQQFLKDERDVRERAEQAYRKVGGRVRGKFTVIDGDG